MAESNLRIGYYSQLAFKKNGSSEEIPNDLYLAVQEFTKHCQEVVLFLNHSTTSNRDTFPVPPKCRLVDLGPVQAMWKRLLGMGFDKKTYHQEVEKLDAIIIQGPTPLLPFLSKGLKKPIPFFLLVGMIAGAYPDQFRAHGALKEYGIKAMVNLIEQQQRKAFRKGVVLANNHLNVETYNQYAPAYLVSKALVTEEDIDLKEHVDLQSPLQLLYYGRVEPDKHIETILKACALLKAEQFAFQLHVVGDYFPPYKIHLEHHVEELALNQYVTFHGKVSFQDKKKYFHNSDIFIFSTCGTEGFPRVIWEAFSYGIPVTAAQYPGSTGFFTHKEELLFFPRKDFKQLAENIKELSHSKALRQHVVDNGLALLKAHTREKGHKGMIDIIKKELHA